MKRVIYNIEGINYIYDARRKGAKYSFDGGQTWKNNGEAVEIVLKWALGLEATKDGNTPFDKGSDIEEYKASVKSPKFTLTTCNIGNDKRGLQEDSKQTDSIWIHRRGGVNHLLDEYGRVWRVSERVWLLRQP